MDPIFGGLAPIAVLPPLHASTTLEWSDVLAAGPNFTASVHKGQINVVLDDRFTDLASQREAVMDALSPPGSIGWLRNQASRIQYKPEWWFEVLDNRYMPDGHWWAGHCYLAITATPSLPFDCKDRVLSLRAMIFPYTKTVDEFRQQVGRAIEQMENAITERWLRYE